MNITKLSLALSLGIIFVAVDARFDARQEALSKSDLASVAAARPADGDAEPPDPHGNLRIGEPNRDGGGMVRHLADALFHSMPHNSGHGLRLLKKPDPTVITGGVPDDKKIDVCHWDEDQEKYVLIRINKKGWENGHSKHDKDCPCEESGCHCGKIPLFSAFGEDECSGICFEKNCSDQNICNGLETCDPILGCQAGTALVCDDNDVCNGLETCDPILGCQAGTALVCDDNDVCNGLETCDPLGGCQAGTALVCDDNDVCNGLETCDPILGCQAGTALVCDDNDVCNGLETCDPILGCQAGTALVCDDNDVCNGLETCDPILGCQPGTPAPDGTACDDGDPDTMDDQCNAGVCEGSDMASGLCSADSLECVACQEEGPDTGGDFDGEAAVNQAGHAVSISDDGLTIAIGAPTNDGDTNDEYDNRGHVRIYHKETSGWTQRGQDIDGVTGGDFDGFSVSLSGNGLWVAVGARCGKMLEGDRCRGRVRVFEYVGDAAPGGEWIQRGFTMNGFSPYDNFGWSVSLSHDGTRVAIGAPENNGSRGYVRVYRFNGNDNYWIYDQIDEDLMLNDKFGYSVSLSNDGNWVACGAFLWGSQNHGLVRVFHYDGTAWTKVGPDIIGESPTDQSGSSVSLSVSGSRKVVAVGAMHNDGNGNASGHVRIYQLANDESSWDLLGVDIDGDAPRDYFGASVSLSSDGQMAVIGAHEITRDTGYASIYGWKGDNPSDPTSGAWELLEQIEGEAHLDQFGVSVSMSGDGSTVVIGASQNDGNGRGSGHARVYRLYDGNDPSVCPI